MNKKLGVFINNTENESDYLINYNNYKNLKKNFDNIIIIDLNNNFSLNLKKYIEKKKINANILFVNQKILYKKLF